MDHPRADVERTPTTRHLLRLVRSAAAGGAATVVDLLALRLLVSSAHWTPREASVPALIAGSVTMFFTQKYGAFGSRTRPTARELALFALVQLGGLVVTGLLFDNCVRYVAAAADHYIAARLIVSNLVWLLYSYPLWHLVFRQRAARSRLVDEPSSRRLREP